jgi:hypothetical protein
MAAVEATGKRKLSAYRIEQITREKELLRQAQQEEVPEEIQNTLVQASQAVPEPTTTTYIDRWVFEIENPSLLPREYLCPDTQAIGQRVAIDKQHTNIPGDKVWNDPIVKSSKK